MNCDITSAFPGIHSVYLEARSYQSLQKPISSTCKMDSFVEKLKQEVQCSLCNHTLTEPTILQCFHTFCKPCIKEHAQLNEQANVFECPTCSSETTLRELSEDGDLEASQIHSRILKVLEFKGGEKVCSVSASHSPVLWHCFNCDQSLCDDCLQCHTAFIKHHKIVSCSDLKKEDLEEMLRRENTCNTHRSDTLELFCKDCDVLVCLLCLKDDHKEHKTMTLQDFKVTREALLSKNLEDIERLRGKDLEKQQQQELAIKMKSSGEKAKKEVKKRTKQLVKYLLDKEEQLLNKIERSIAKADRNLRMIRHTPAAQQYIRNIIEKGTASDMIDCQDKEGCTKFTYIPFKKDMSGMVFDPNEVLSQQVMNATLGNVRFTELSSHIISEIKVDDTIMALEKANLTLVTKHCSGKLNYDDTDEVDIHFTPEDDVKLIERMTKTDGEVRVEFIPRLPGQLTVEVNMNGHPVSNSPLMMDVKPQLIKKADNSQLKMALHTGTQRFRGIAVNRVNSKIAIADDSIHCVRVFNIDGELLLTYGGEGSKEEQLQDPEGLAFLNDEDLVIVDYGNHRMCVVSTTTGTLVKTFGCKGNANGEFSYSYGVHVDDECNIIVSDTSNKRVQVFTMDGEYQYQISLPNQDTFSPVCTVTHNGLFYVSDSNNAVIHVVEMKDNSPTIVSTIGGKGTVDGQLQMPYGIAIDNDHNLLVCDNSTGYVHKFTLDGRYIGKTGKFASPRYLAVLNDGQVICTTVDKGVFCFSCHPTNKS